MAKSEIKIICPYIKRVFRNCIYCAPIADCFDCNAISFDTIATRDEYIFSFCACECWRGCVLAQLHVDINAPDSGIAQR